MLIYQRVWSLKIPWIIHENPMNSLWWSNIAMECQGWNHIRETIRPGCVEYSGWDSTTKSWRFSHELLLLVQLDSMVWPIAINSYHRYLYLEYQNVASNTEEDKTNGNGLYVFLHQRVSGKAHWLQKNASSFHIKPCGWTLKPATFVHGSTTQPSSWVGPYAFIFVTYNL